MLRVLVITYYWPPAGGAGVQRWLKLCKYLPEHGVLPTVITVDPDKASYPLRDESLLNEVHDDVEVIRTNSFEPLQIYGKLFGKEKVPYGGFANTTNEGFLSKASRFIRGNFFIPDARKGWNKYAFAAAKKAIADKSIDIVVTTGPPHSTHLVGLQLKEELGVKWVADFRDPWTGIYYNDMMLRTKRAQQHDAALEQSVLEHADLVVANCNSNRELLQEKVDAKSKFVTVENGYDAEDFVDFEHVTSEKFNIVYTGTMASSYEPEAFISALIEFAQKVEPEVVLQIAGNVSPDLKTKIEESALGKHVNFHGYVNHGEVLKLLAEAHISLNIFPRTANDRGIPGKLFEYLAARKPILNIGPPDGDAAKIIHQCQLGKTVTRDHVALFDALSDIHRAWKGNTQPRGNDEVARYSRQALSKKYANYLRQL